MKWTRSSLCSADQPSCVEVTTLPDRCVAVRDSKNPGAAHLVFTRAEWTAFLAGAVAGDFDRI
jgi:hypothetical protein